MISNVLKRLTVIQHTSAEYLGLMEDHLEGRRIRFNYCRPFVEGTPIPHQNSVGDGLIILGGGPWGSAGVRDVPSLQAEIALTKACLMEGIPVIGMGLGAQILAIAAGGKSEACELNSSVGTAHRLGEDALAGFLPESFPLITYGRDKPVLPAYAEVLAENEAGEPAIFQIGKNNFGFLGHPGFKPAMVEDLVMEFEESAENSSETLEGMRAIVTQIEDALIPIMTGLVQLTDIME